MRVRVRHQRAEHCSVRAAMTVNAVTLVCLSLGNSIVKESSHATA